MIVARSRGLWAAVAVAVTLNELMPENATEVSRSRRVDHNLHDTLQAFDPGVPGNEALNCCAVESYV